MTNIIGLVIVVVGGFVVYKFFPNAFTKVKDFVVNVFKKKS